MQKNPIPSCVPALSFGAGAWGLAALLRTLASSPGLSILLKVNFDGILGGCITGLWKEGDITTPLRECAS